jgi:predicted PurR-regulated permease PerM
MNSNPTIFTYMLKAISLINSTIVPFFFALAFIFYIYNIYKFFIQNGSEPKSIESGKTFAFWGIVGFAVMLSVWGLVNILINTFALDSSTHPKLPTFGENSSNASANLPSPLPSTPTVNGTSFSNTAP